MRKRRLLWFVAAVFFATLTISHATAQTKTVTGKVTIGIHKMDLESDGLYVFTVEGKGFRPRAQIKPGFGSFRPVGSFTSKTIQAVFVPEKNGAHTLFVLPDIFSLSGNSGETFEYTFTMKRLVLEEKPLLEKNETLVAADPPFKRGGFVQRKHHKAYKLKMVAGTTYLIDLMRRGPGFGKGGLDDPYLYILDAKGEMVGRDDDGGKGLNSQLVFEPEATGSYQIIASGLSDALGDFTLRVQASKQGQ